jgi:hypothetical protein
MSSSMEFWATCVKPGKPVKVNIDDGMTLRLTQVPIPPESPHLSATASCLPPAASNVDGKEATTWTSTGGRAQQSGCTACFKKRGRAKPSFLVWVNRGAAVVFGLGGEREKRRVCHAIAQLGALASAQRQL